MKHILPIIYKSKDTPLQTMCPFSLEDFYIPHWGFVFISCNEYKYYSLFVNKLIMLLTHDLLNCVYTKTSQDLVSMVNS